jgi:branched-chain amino acid transport system permease protein
MIWVDTIVQGVLLGGLYALFAAGLSLVFGIMRLVNLAHGDLIVLAAYLILVAVTVLGLHPLLAVLLAAPVMFTVGWGLQRLILTRTLGDDILPPLLVTFGLSIVIQNALLEGFSADSQRIRVGDIETASVALGPVNVGLIPLLTFATAVAVIFALNQLFYRFRRPDYGATDGHPPGIRLCHGDRNRDGRGHHRRPVSWRAFKL